jgi:hypothetical protein
MSAGGLIRNFRLQRRDGSYAIPAAAARGGPFFRSVDALTKHYRSNNIPQLRNSSSSGGFFLAAPVLPSQEAERMARTVATDEFNSAPKLG